jgi:hypothetical protein
MLCYRLHCCRGKAPSRPRFLTRGVKMSAHAREIRVDDILYLRVLVDLRAVQPAQASSPSKKIVKTLNITLDS